MEDSEMAFAPCEPSLQPRFKVEEVFGRYPTNKQYGNMQGEEYFDNLLYIALRDLGVLKEYMVLEESFETGVSKPVKACWERILGFINHFFRNEKCLRLEAEFDSLETIKKYQVEVLLNVAQKHSSLEVISFWDIPFEDDCWEVIAEILAGVMVLEFRNVFRNTWKLGLFARSLAVRGAPLTCLMILERELVLDEEAADYIKLIFEHCPNLEEIHFGGRKMTLDGGRMIGNIVANHKSLTTLDLSGWNDLPTQGLRDLLDVAFKANVSITYLQLYDVKFGDNFESCLIHAAISLETLHLGKSRFGANSNPQFFKSLKSNTKLKHLILSWSRNLENLGSFEDLISAITGNMTLEEIKFGRTSWDEDGKAALVQEALDQRLRQRDYFYVLRKELRTAPLKVATSGRILFCGQPYSGKSQLAYTMMQEENTVGCKVKNFFKRTKGIEIHVLKNDKDMQVVLWDLAGQEIFRALHEHLFPKITTICLYLFVFNPFNCSGDGLSSPKAMENAFEDELKAWLRFLCTNSNISKGYLPHVVIIITHRDKLSKSKKMVFKEIHDIIDKVSKQFEGLIEIWKDLEHVFYVDARERRDIQCILPYLYDHFKRVSTVHVDQVPEVCNDVNSYILKKQSKLSFTTVKGFNDICKQANKTMSQVCGDSVFVAMRKYLHDVGTIIDLGEEDLVITNPNWLTKDFLGQLMSIGHGFESSKSKDSIRLENGYVSLSQLNSLFCLLKKSSKVDEDTLMRILIGLHLCHEVGKEYFVPILFKASKSTLISKWKSSCPEDQFLGLRLSCANNSVTFLTTAVFSRFQVYMHRKCEEMFDKSVIFRNELNRIWISVDGYEVFVECDYSKGQHVDVLVKITRTHKTAIEDAWSFIWNIVGEIRKFYAHPKGAPGVALVSKIIRKECVERPTPCHLRVESQAISIQQLKESLEESMRNFSSEQLRISGQSLLHCHTWPEWQQARLQCGSVPALDLLRGCPEAQKLQEKVNEICGKLEEKTLEVKEHEKTRSLIASVAKNICEKSTRSMPKFPYFSSEDVGLCRRLVAKLNFSIPMKLHFMCESSQREHYVHDPEGFEITVEQKNRELVRFLVQSSIETIVVVAKVAMKTTTGISGDIPFMPLFAGDETKVIFVGGATTVEKLLEKVDLSEEDMVGEGSTSLGEWPYMKDEIEPQLQGKYGKLFGLYKVEYKENYLQAREGWLCRKCIDEGNDANIISKVSNVG